MSEKRQQQDGAREGTGEPVEGMNISEIWIRRPVDDARDASILIFGILAYQRLPVSDLPTIDYPTITVSAGLPGASPRSWPPRWPRRSNSSSPPSGIDNITSSSSQGSTNVTIQFNLDRDIDKAAADVQSGISKALRQLPQA